MLGVDGREKPRLAPTGFLAPADVDVGALSGKPPDEVQLLAVGREAGLVLLPVGVDGLPERPRCGPDHLANADEVVRALQGRPVGPDLPAGVVVPPRPGRGQDHHRRRPCRQPPQPAALVLLCVFGHLVPPCAALGKGLLPRWGFLYATRAASRQPTRPASRPAKRSTDNRHGRQAGPLNGRPASPLNGRPASPLNGRPASSLNSRPASPLNSQEAPGSVTGWPGPGGRGRCTRPSAR